MGLIIFNKKQQVSPERFGFSLVAGSLLILLLGALHGKMHHMGYFFPKEYNLDPRIFYVAGIIAVVLAVIFIKNMERFNYEEDAEVVGSGLKFSENVSDAQLLIFIIALGNMILLGTGLYLLVWQPVMTGYEVISIFGRIAISIIGIMLPLNYAGRLQLEIFLKYSQSEVQAYVWQKYTKTLFWVLIVFWATLLASYILLILSSPSYCHWLACR